MSGQTSRASRSNFPRLSPKRKNWALANSIFFWAYPQQHTTFDAGVIPNIVEFLKDPWPIIQACQGLTGSDLGHDNTDPK